MFYEFYLQDCNGGRLHCIRAVGSESIGFSNELEITDFLRICQMLRIPPNIVRRNQNAPISVLLGLECLSILAQPITRLNGLDIIYPAITKDLRVWSTPLSSQLFFAGVYDLPSQTGQDEPQWWNQSAGIHQPPAQHPANNFSQTDVNRTPYISGTPPWSTQFGSNYQEDLRSTFQMILDRKYRDEESNFDQEDSQRNYNFLSEPSNTTRIRSQGFYSRTPLLEVPLDLSVRTDGPDEIILQHIPSDEQSSESSQHEH